MAASRCFATLIIGEVFSAALFGQSLVGTWQGASPDPQGLSGEYRTVMQVSIADADRLKATLYRIDQEGGLGINVKSITLQGLTIKMSIVEIGATYEGTLGADGTSITGTWTQGASSRPLNLTRTTPQTAWTIPEPPPPQKRMAPDADPEFELATIKPTKEGTAFTIHPTPSGMLVVMDASVDYLIKFAYGVLRGR